MSGRKSLAPRPARTETSYSAPRRGRRGRFDCLQIIFAAQTCKRYLGDMTSQPPPYQQPPFPQQPPYQQGPQPLPYQVPGAYGGGVCCPKCRNPHSSKVGFTWWGGLIGPRMLSHVKCVGCGYAYNGKTGRSNTT